MQNTQNRTMHDDAPNTPGNPYLRLPTAPGVPYKCTRGPNMGSLTATEQFNGRIMAVYTYHTGLPCSYPWASVVVEFTKDGALTHYTYTRLPTPNDYDNGVQVAECNDAALLSDDRAMAQLEMGSCRYRGPCGTPTSDSGPVWQACAAVYRACGWL